MQEISELISAIRRTGLSQMDLAQRLETSQALVSRWERGVISDGAMTLLKLQRLARKLRVRVSKEAA